MLKMVDGTGIIGVDMICPLGVSTPQPPNYDRVELEGAGMLVLPNSLDAPLERLELGGKTEGKKQVIPVGEIEQGTVTAHAGNNYPSDYRVRTKSYINLTSGVYEVMCTGAKLGNVIFYSAENKYEKMLSETHIPLPIKFTLEENKTVRILFSNSESTPIAPTDIKNAILEADVSPEHPQDIVNSGKWNEETQKYEVKVKVTGKNLLNLQKEPDVKGLYQGWKVGNGDKGTLSIKDKGNNADISECYFGLNSDGTTSNSVAWLVDNGVIKRYHIESIEKMYACMYPPNETTIKKLTERFEIQYEYGSIATEYQPYKEQSLTLTSDRPITKWDRLVEQGGEIGWLCGSEILQFTDAEGFKFFHNAQNKAVVNVLKAIDPDYSDSFSVNNSYCTHFINNIQAYYDSGDTCSFTLSTRDGNCLYFKFGSTSDISDLEKFEKWILEKRPVVIYKTKDLQFIPLPQSEQNAIRALKTYYPTTVITVDGGELDPDIKVTYRKEI